MEIVVADDAGALARLAAGRIADLLGAALAERPRAGLAVSGGTTPAGMFRVLAGTGLDWERIHIFQVDERVAPDGHPDRNAALLGRDLLDVAALPSPNVHLMPVTAPDLAAAAAGYATTLAAVTGDGRLDVVHLGLGDDGHTASWPPGDPVADLTDGPDVAVVGPFAGRRRMTLTPPAVNRARAVVWLVDGAGKSAAVERMLAGDRSVPASRVRTDAAVLFLGPDGAPVSAAAGSG